ncbi:MAG TPA: tripartite tricarboxylate transporter substrate binding protein [Xanthobacteraceae bacterium]|jgi:tripartite-type tricarboxylate transporter receptor subunit TctC|nr:tripartite tricarboxylate transporter substrate binding protein [Xanthobacteraceae bacterium]
MRSSKSKCAITLLLAGFAVFAVALLPFAIARHAAADQVYPSNTIRVVTPFAAGAASDIALRILAEKMSGKLSVPVIVQNQPGGGGVIAARSVTNAAPDGYTIAWVGNNTAISVSLFKEPFDPRQEFRPIVGVSEFAYLFVTGASSRFNSLREWIEAARAKPGTLTIGTSSAGTSNHLAALLFKSLQKLDVAVVPYRGPSELSVALLRNDIDLVVNAYGGLRAGIDAKQIRALSVTSATRLPELPDVPTMREAGVPDFEVSSWNSLYGPKDMPQQAVDTIAAAATDVLMQPDVKAKFKDIGFEAKPLPAAAQDQRMRTEIDRWAKVIAEAGIEKQ